METAPDESSQEEGAPKGVLFLSNADVEAMVGDFGVQRTVRLMKTDMFPRGVAGAVIVMAVVRASAQEPPPAAR